MKPSRRHMLQTAAAAGLAVPASAAKSNSKSTAGVYERLGVKPVINGMGTVTVLGGSLMPPEVIRAMDDAAQHFVHLPDLQKKAGIRLAEMLKVPAAMVTCGAAASIAVGTVACMARGDHRKMQQLPDTDGIPFEVIQQKTHRSGYEHQMRVAGAKVIHVETREELEKAIGPRTAMMFFLNKHEPDGRIKRDEWVKIAREHNVPTLNDAAADVPPKENLWNYVNRNGFDLVAFSGGKGMTGPQSAGLLLGRKDLIEAATEAQSPYGGVGRGMKVGKEEIVGMVATVERYLKVDHEAESRELDRRVSEMMAVLSKVDGLRVSRHLPRIANEVPHLMVEWDEGSGRRTSKQVHAQLVAGDPAIYTLLQGKGKIVISVWMMRGSEHRTVAKRFAEAFTTS
ncbi:MAG TPA: aminotransferase class V-fold PLP-dependent enzyme [Bryobacteraceae bacterium]|nr:aminotransferase class V-fold PLP-dependent enzyme [Bryobacteraceae bacterium]